MDTVLQHLCNRITPMFPGLLPLLFILVIAGRKKEGGINEWLRTKKNNGISCTPYKSVNEPDPWPTGNNNGNGCMHQSVVAALPGKSRVKRAFIHDC